NFQDFSHPVWCKVHFFSNFLWGWVSSQILKKLTLNPYQFINCFHHMNWDTNCSCLIGNCTGYSLSNPPGGIRTKFTSFCMVKLFYGCHQAHIHFVNKLYEQHSTTNGAFCNAHD